MVDYDVSKSIYMDTWTDDEIKGKILHKLTRAGKFQASHTAIENLQSGFPKDLVGKVKVIIAELKKEGIFCQNEQIMGNKFPSICRKRKKFLHTSKSSLKSSPGHNLINIRSAQTYSLRSYQ